MNEENLSILALITNASVLVQLVMATLFIMSVLSWIMIVQRALFLNGAQRSFRDFEDTFGLALISIFSITILPTGPKKRALETVSKMYSAPAFASSIV